MHGSRIKYFAARPSHVVRSRWLVAAAAFMHITIFPLSAQPPYTPDPSWTIDRGAGPDELGDGRFYGIKRMGPLGQSFQPELPGIDFADIYTLENVWGGVGVTLSLQLREGDIGGRVLATAGPQNLPGSAGFNHFVFPSRIALDPGMQYCLQPVLASGEECLVKVTYFGVPGQILYANGKSSDVYNLWFREGIVVPEPAVTSLCFVGLMLIGCRPQSIRAIAARLQLKKGSTHSMVRLWS